MIAFHSIRWRLQLWYGLLFVALLLAFGVMMYLHERTLRLERVDEELEHLAFELNGANRPPGPPRGSDDPRRAKQPRAIADVLTAKHVDRGFYYGVWTKNRTPFTGSANAPADLPKPTGGPAVRTRGTLREAFIESNPGDVALAGRDVAADLASLRRFGWKLAAAGGATLALTLLIGGWLVARALRPIRDIGDAAQKIATGDLSQRINTRDTDTELGQLAGVLNSTFGRLETSFAQQARFTADAAHELRTPVTVMLTHVQNGLASENLSPEHREAFEAAQRAAQRMRRLLESLLALARLDSGQESIKPETIDLSTLAHECVDLVQPLAARRSIVVHAQLDATECTGDPQRLEQVITNLLANAIHYNREGGEVRVRTYRENGDARLVVADNGPGIGREHLPHIFGRFYRADKARTSAQGRTGLGLAISRAIVEAHGGTIEVESEFGQGATFTVRIPAK